MTTAPQIPIQNIYYLLCYAWNKLEERDIVEVSGIDSAHIMDLFAKVLIGGISHLFKRGLDRGYVSFSTDSGCLKGKICFAPTIKRNLLTKAQANCEYDELSHNVLHNQILKSTTRYLINVENLDKDLKNELIGLYRRLYDIDEINLTNSTFTRVQLHKNNAFYDFLLKICELVYDNLLVSKDPGKSKFRDFFQDKNRMAYLFEEFVRNFYKIEASGYKVRREDIYWGPEGADRDSISLLPKMITDISIESDNSKAIIDTKYYKEALRKHFDQEKIREHNIYQIFAYLKNLEKNGGKNLSCNGVLLYPTVDKDINEIAPLDSKHKLIVRTINLNQDWKMIHKDLIDLLARAL